MPCSRAESQFPYPAASRDVHFESTGMRDRTGGSESRHRPPWTTCGLRGRHRHDPRDLQGAAKKLGRPWEVGKAFEHSAPCTPVHPAGAVGHPAEGRIWLDVNGRTGRTET